MQDNIGKKLALSEAALKDALQGIKSSLPGDLSERLPAEHALHCLTAGNAIPADLPVRPCSPPINLHYSPTHLAGTSALHEHAC